MNNSFILGLAGLAIVLLATALLVVISIIRRSKAVNINLREIPAFSRLHKATGLSVEDGTRMHISLGHSNMISQQSASAFAGLSMMYRLTNQTSLSDRPPIATSGDAILSIFSQDTLQNAYRKASAEDQYDPTTGRLTGLTPFSYAAGALSVMADENVSTNIIIGNYGTEIALLTDAAERTNAFSLAATDSLTAQAIAYGTAEEPLIGEELYAAGAYIKAGSSHKSSLLAQDILRWVLIAGLVLGAASKVFGIL